MNVAPQSAYRTGDILEQNISYKSYYDQTYEKNYEFINAFPL
jgi:hypothetical protein